MIPVQCVLESKWNTLCESILQTVFNVLYKWGNFFCQMIFILTVKFLFFHNHNYNLLNRLNHMKLYIYKSEIIKYHQFYMVQPNKINAHKWNTLLLFFTGFQTQEIVQCYEYIIFCFMMIMFYFSPMMKTWKKIKHHKTALREMWNK